MTDINDLTKDLARELTRYSGLVKEEFEEAKKETAKNLVKDLKQTSPELTGDYRKGWKMKKEKDGYVVHNKTDYQLTHLLEKGHAKRDGGRVSPQVHIKPAEEKHIKEFLEKVEKAIRK